MFREIDLSLLKLEPMLEIAKPNKTTIGNLDEASQIKLRLSLNDIHSLTFELPYEIEKRNKFVPNPNISKTKERFLVNFKLGHLENWFIITEINESMEDTDRKVITCKSLENELKNKLVRGYQVTSYTAREVLEDMEALTTWRIGTINVTFDDRRRSFDVSEKTLYDFINEVAQTFNAIVEFDTVNRLINFRTQEEIRKFRGMRVSYGDLIKRLNKRSNPEEMVTRLHVFGHEDLSINRVNPTGSSYIEDFTFFMNPFQRDENKNTISSSEYMSDELCHAILDYQELVESKRTEFSDLLVEQSSLQIVLANYQSQLAVKQGELAIIQDQLDIAKSQNQDTAQLKSDLTAKQTEINNLNTLIEDINIDLQAILDSIVTLKNALSIESNFTPELIEERDSFIIERTWSDSNYIDENELYTDAVEKFKEYKLPRETFDISIINFFAVLEEHKRWDKLYLGEDLEIFYDKFKIDHRAMILSIDFDFESEDISLEISDVKSAKSKDRKLADLIKNINSTSTTIDMSKALWDKSSKDLGEVQELLNGVWDATKRNINAGVNNSIDIGRRGIIITNPDNPDEMLIIQSGTLAISRNGGEDWQTAINSSGVFAERLVGQLIAGVNLIIENESGTFKVDGDGFEVKQTATRILDENDENLIDKWNSTEENANNYTNSQLTPVIERVTAAEQKITDESIVSTVTQSDTYKNDLGDIATNLDAVVEKQTELEQDMEQFNFNISMSSGVNILKDSLGFGDMSSWMFEGEERIESIQGGIVESAGFPSGIHFRKDINPLTSSTYQVVRVNLGDTYTLSGKVLKTTTEMIDSDFNIFVYDADSLVELAKFTFFSGQDYNFEKFVLPFAPITNRVMVKLECGGREDEVIITGLMLNVGSIPLQWSNHPEETYNTNIKFDINGLKVFQSTSGMDRSYVQITSEEFASYYDANDGNGFQKVMYLNQDELVVEKVRAQREFTMGTIKIIQVNSPNFTGWVYVPTDNL